MRASRATQQEVDPAYERVDSIRWRDLKLEFVTDVLSDAIDGQGQAVFSLWVLGHGLIERLSCYGTATRHEGSGWDQS